MAVNGIALGALAAGSVLLYSAVMDKSVLSTIEAVIKGEPPSSAAKAAAPAAGVTAAAGLTGESGVQPSGLPSAGTYTPEQLQALWVMAGGSQAAKVNAACHAMQESSGNPLVTSANPDGGINVGLWQLDTRGKGAGYTVAELQNAVNNARITVSASGNGTDWSAWATPGC